MPIDEVMGLMLGVPGAQGGGATPIVYLLRDEFLTDAVAPLSSPRICEPGPGTLTMVQDDGHFAIDARRMTFPQQATEAWSELHAVKPTPYDRVCGRAMRYVLTRSAVDGHGTALGWWSANAITVPTSQMIAGIQTGRALTLVYDNTSYVTNGGPLLPANNIDYHVYHILRSTGSWLVINNNLEWVGVAGSDAVYAGFANRDGAGSLKDRWSVVDLGGIWASDYGPATAHVATPVDGVTATGKADGMVELTWTPATAETLELSFRRTDDDNRYLVRCDQAAETIKVYKVEGGVEAELAGGTTTQTWTVETSYRIVVKYYGTTILVFVDLTGKNTATATSFNASATGVKASGFSSAANLVAWPRQLASPLSQAERLFAAFGDSKSLGYYQSYLATDLMIATGDFWRETCDRELAIGGYAISQWEPVIDEQLALMRESEVPEYVLCNIGANDVHDGNLVEGTWKADYLYCLDAMHAKWPDATMYLMRPWRRDYDADCDTLAGWIADIVAARDWCELGPDERVFLENGDDGETYTGDGIHPSGGDSGGYDLTAQQWAAVLFPD